VAFVLGTYILTHIQTFKW